MNYSLFELWLAWVSAHLLGDFVFQSDQMATRKSDNNVLASHATIHGVLAWVLTLRSGAALGGAVLIGVTHGLIDFVKVRRAAKGPVGFTIDQLAHLAIITALAVWLSPSASPPFWRSIFGAGWIGGLYLLSGIILCIKVTGHFIGFAVQPYLDEIRRESGSEPIGVEPSNRGLTRAGRVIGQWERALIFLFVLVGQPSGIGFLIAAKSIFRFGELKDPANRREAEYITIGTLMSFGTAMAIAYATIGSLHFITSRIHPN